MFYRDGDTKLAVSLGLRTTQDTLQALHKITSDISLAEVRLDLMDEFDLPRLVQESPCNLILTNRPVREGGNFKGSEKDRIKPLREGIKLGVSHLDVEWDCVDILLNQRKNSATKLDLLQKSYSAT